MFHFTKKEKIVILFLIGAIILGTGVKWVKARYVFSESKLESEKTVTYNAPTNLNKKININFASQETLEKLPCIGPGLAGRIIEYRTKTGPFKSPEEIKKIRGIGEKRWQKVKDLICINNETTMP